MKNQNNLIKLFTALLILLIPNSAFAEVSFTYNIASKMISATEGFSLSLFSSLSEAFKPLYISIATIGLIVILAKYLFTRVPPLREMLSFTIAMTIASNIAFDPAFFKYIIYDTFFDTLYSFDQFVVRSSAGHMRTVTQINYNSLEGMFQTVDASLGGISSFGWDTFSDNKGWFNWTNVPLFFEACIIYLLYLFVAVYFLIIFTVSIFGAHMMIIAMPIAISLYPFKRFRHLASNCFNGMFHYGLVTVFSCVAISIVVYIADDLVLEAAKLRDAAKVAGEDLKIPASFLTASIMVGFLSIMIIKISTEFASRVLNSANSQLGGAFPMIVAGATTMAKGSATIYRVASPALATSAAYGDRKSVV